MKPCHARSCGMFPVVRDAIGNLVQRWEIQSKTFVGVDVSSTCTGLTAVRFKQNSLKVVYSVALGMQKKASDSKNEILHRRFDILLEAFHVLRKQNSFVSMKDWEISVEDKIVRAGAAKGIIGSHTLAEVIVAARIAAYQVFPEHVPSKVNPRTARAGLGLNLMGEAAGREETKANVLSFVKRAAPDFNWTGKSSDEDRADAFVIALSAVRSALNRDLIRDPNVFQMFKGCHGSSLGLHDSRKATDRRKIDVTIEEELNDRIQAWVDELWLQEQFPKITTT